MANDKNFTEFFNSLPKAFQIDADATADAFKTWASFNERFAGIAIETASRANEIATSTTQESLSHLREVTKAQDEPREYGQALVNFVQGQVSLTRETAEAFGQVLESAREQTASLFAEAGEKARDEGEARVKKAANEATRQTRKVTKTVEKAADKVAEKAEAAA